MSNIDNKKIIFHNMGHYGDIHYSREFIKDIIIKINATAPYTYSTNCNKKIFQDINEIEFSDYNLYHCMEHELLVDQTNVLINTWIGSSERKYLFNGGCCLNGNYQKYTNMYELLNIKIENPFFYVPEINFNLYNTKSIDTFIAENLHIKKILVCNGNVLSGQSINFDMNIIIDRLAKKYTNCLFLLTDNSNKIILENIKYTSDIIQSTGNDLNEISYLSTHCDIIVGRGSGPYCCCFTKTNLLNANKKLIGFTKLYEDAHWIDMKEHNLLGAEQIWSNNFAFDSMYDIIEQEIKKFL